MIFSIVVFRQFCPILGRAITLLIQGEKYLKFVVVVSGEISMWYMHASWCHSSCTKRFSEITCLISDTTLSQQESLTSDGTSKVSNECNNVYVSILFACMVMRDVQCTLLRLTEHVYISAVGVGMWRWENDVEKTSNSTYHINCHDNKLWV